MSASKLRCVACRRRKLVALVPLPLTGELRCLCAPCRGPVFLAHMHSLLVMHG